MSEWASKRASHSNQVNAHAVLNIFIALYHFGGLYRLKIRFHSLKQTFRFIKKSMQHKFKNRLVFGLTFVEKEREKPTVQSRTRAFIHDMPIWFVFISVCSLAHLTNVVYLLLFFLIWKYAILLSLFLCRLYIVRVVLRKNSTFDKDYLIPVVVDETKARTARTHVHIVTYKLITHTHRRNDSSKRGRERKNSKGKNTGKVQTCSRATLFNTIKASIKLLECRSSHSTYRMAINL